MRVARIVYCIQDSLVDQSQAEGTSPVQIKIYLSIYRSYDGKTPIDH